MKQNNAQRKVNRGFLRLSIEAVTDEDTGAKTLEVRAPRSTAGLDGWLFRGRPLSSSRGLT